jgi:hypothetical protein
MNFSKEGLFHYFRRQKLLLHKYYSILFKSHSKFTFDFSIPSYFMFLWGRRYNALYNLLAIQLQWDTELFLIKPHLVLMYYPL